MANGTRLLAPIGPLVGELRTRHAIGIPNGPQKLMPYPQLLVLKEQNDGVYLFGYTAANEFGGDTWHESIEDAKDQAVFEYETALGAWCELPPHVSDPVEFAIDIGMIASPDV